MTKRASHGNINRRGVLKGAGALALGGVSAAVAGPGFAATPDDRRLVVILLRGGFDGLSLLVPHGDPNYADLRGNLAFSPPSARGAGVIPLRDGIGLNPAAATLLPYWLDGSLSFAPAAATPYRGSNHFEAAAVLENGASTPNGLDSGWLARASSALGGGKEGAPLAVSLEGPVPLILRGGEGAAAWRPKHMPPPIIGFHEKLRLLYRDDPLFAPLLAEEHRDREENAERLGASHKMGELNQDFGAPSAGTFAMMSETVGALLAEEAGPRIAVIQVSGWDSHINQGAANGALSLGIAGLSGGLAGLAEAMGNVWDRTAILVQSEFGRTVTVNRTGGTGHGLAGVHIVMGGALAGGGFIGDWPGLSADTLDSNGALKPALDSRVLIKAVLKDHLGLSAQSIAKSVLPGSGKIQAASNLFG